MPASDGYGIDVTFGDFSATLANSFYDIRVFNDLYPLPCCSIPGRDSYGIDVPVSDSSLGSIDFGLELGRVREVAGDQAVLDILWTDDELPFVPPLFSEMNLRILTLYSFADNGDTSKWWGIRASVTSLAEVPDDTNLPVPEPGTMLLFGAGLAGMAAMMRRLRN
jgi:hypothetical protein